MRTLVPMEWVEPRWGLELVVLAMHSRFVWVVVPQMWEFSPYTIFLAKPWPEPAAVVQDVLRKLLLWIGTSFLNSLGLGFGKQH